MTFTDLCNNIKKEKMIDRVISVAGVIAIFGGLIGFSFLACVDEYYEDVAQRNEELMLENICIAQEIALIIQEKDEKTARLITILFNEYLKGWEHGLERTLNTSR